MSCVWDAGLQPERTELAWRRTSLSLAVISLVAVRLLPLEFDSWLWIAPGTLGIIASALIWWAAKKRYRATVDTLQGESTPALPDGSLLLAVAILATGIGVAGLLVIAH